MNRLAQFDRTFSVLKIRDEADAEPTELRKKCLRVSEILSALTDRYAEGFGIGYHKNRLQIFAARTNLANLIIILAVRRSLAAAIIYYAERLSQVI